MEENNIIGNRIQTIRNENHLTQEELAAIAGVSKGTVSRWESGEIRTLRIDKVNRIASAYGYSPMWIMGFDVGKKAQSDETETKIDQIYHALTTMSEEQIDKLIMFMKNFL